MINIYLTIILQKKLIKKSLMIINKYMSFNPFEDEVENIDEVTEFEVTIWKEQSGRKTNTYFTGWDIDIKQMKDYIKDLKKKHGTNGSVKYLDEDDSQKKLKIQLQGDNVDKVYSFLVEKGIKEENIVIKG